MGLLDRDIKAIISKKNKYINNIRYRLILHTPKKDISILRLLNVETMRDYVGNVADYIITEFMLQAGDYIYDVHPFMDNLEMTIIVETETTRISTIRYKFIIANNLGNIEGTRYTRMSRQTLNETEEIHVEGQCLLREVEAIRTSYIDGIYSNTNVENLLTSEIVNVTSKLKIEGKPINLNINIVKPHNDMTYNHINIQTGTPLLKLASEIQNGQYGIYNGMINNYIQMYKDKPTMFIYPLYDYEQYEKAKNKLLIFKNNNSYLDYQENTYTVENDIVRIIATNKMKTIDSGDNEYMSKGVGLTTNNGDMIGRSDVKVDKSSGTVNDSSRVSSSSDISRRDGVNKIKYIGNDSNMYKHRSIINKDSMSIIQLQWNFANDRFLFPGMPVCFMYEDHGSVTKLYGTLLSCYFNFSQAKKTTSALLNIAVEKPLIKKNN